MRIDQFKFKTLKSAPMLAAIVLLLASLAPATTTGNNPQDQSFRLMNIERKLDQLQIRVDTIERAYQNQAINNSGSSNASTQAQTQALLDLQRQQISLAGQLVTMQKQMLELKKEIDRVAARENDQGKDADKKDEQKQEAKPKAPTKKP
jgi:hypothetical protein